MTKVEVGRRVKVEAHGTTYSGVVAGLYNYVSGKGIEVKVKVRYDDGGEGHFSLHQVAQNESELDAIERDMADLFARMRAAIERLK